MQTQKETRPTLRAQPLVNDMRYRLFFLHRAYHFFELTSLSTRFSSIDSANIFFNSAFLPPNSPRKTLRRTLDRTSEALVVFARL